MITTIDNIAQIVTVVALVGYAVYRQTHVARVTRKGRFTMALVYAVIGAAVGGFATPHSTGAFVLLAASILLSLVVGVGRGALTRVWQTADGAVLRQGTRLTVAMFLAMIAVKIGMGVFAYVAHIQDASGFAEIMIMMAIMVAVQAEMIQRRADNLVNRSERTVLTASPA